MAISEYKVKNDVTIDAHGCVIHSFALVRGIATRAMEYTYRREVIVVHSAL